MEDHGKVRYAYFWLKPDYRGGLIYFVIGIPELEDTKELPEERFIEVKLQELIENGYIDQTIEDAKHDEMKLEEMRLEEG
ncbi:hypothetical protein [Natranaerobius trueperi]|uniref:Uncharacterized protein n=1 Tax=Natranaerobius trueperi TaxID=759412 RepID=A0A226BX85_9FIRM|nr:hypothetical protein [Natranaerobius trueperi]OWZ82750.1 hypothetical protein CDO51_12425 [Natranaerobius trueperi]